MTESAYSLDEIDKIRVSTIYNWYGGKFALCKDIMRMTPKHKIHIEAFAGSAVLTKNKKPSEVEIINDLHPGVANFFRVLKNERKTKNLQKLLMEESSEMNISLYWYFNKWKETGTGDEIEDARRYFFLVNQNFMGKPGGSWAGNDTAQHKRGAKFQKAIDSLMDYHDRFKKVIVENMPCIALMQKYNKPDVFWYLDPPYFPDTRLTAKEYDFEMLEEDHQELLALLAMEREDETGIKGSYLLSGYKGKEDYPVYQTYLSHRPHAEKRHVLCAAIYRKEDPQHAGKDEVRKRKFECFWYNYDMPAKVVDYLQNREGKDKAYKFYGTDGKLLRPLLPKKPTTKK